MGAVMREAPRGYTLLEVMLVCGVLAMLAAAALPLWLPRRDQQRMLAEGLRLQTYLLTLREQAFRSNGGVLSCFAAAAGSGLPGGAAAGRLSRRRGLYTDSAAAPGGADVCRRRVLRRPQYGASRASPPER
ncbi:prepilin-type N-terminal cleavage/methylation domain-containing protein [Edwardsiella anguillarum]|nr:prepilin-type N-terminal cleavage/methylation domain-containing protein [Edwardsiella anguillarum]